jgi:hypothetical protein
VLRAEVSEVRAAQPTAVSESSASSSSAVNAVNVPSRLSLSDFFGLQVPHEAGVDVVALYAAMPPLDPSSCPYRWWAEHGNALVQGFFFTVAECFF